MSLVFIMSIQMVQSVAKCRWTSWLMSHWPLIAAIVNLEIVKVPQGEAFDVAMYDVTENRNACVSMSAYMIWKVVDN